MIDDCRYQQSLYKLSNDLRNYSKEKTLAYKIICPNHLLKSIITTLFKNTGILNFKSQLTAAVSHLSGPLGKQLFTLRVQKVMVCDLVLVDCDPFCVFR